MQGKHLVNGWRSVRNFSHKFIWCHVHKYLLAHCKQNGLHFVLSRYVVMKELGAKVFQENRSVTHLVTFKDSAPPRTAVGS
jgi:hypothetical protein